MISKHLEDVSLGVVYVRSIHAASTSSRASFLQPTYIGSPSLKRPPQVELPISPSCIPSQPPHPRLDCLLRDGEILANRSSLALLPCFCCPSTVKCWLTSSPTRGFSLVSQPDRKAALSLPFACFEQLLQSAYVRPDRATLPRHDLALRPPPLPLFAFAARYTHRTHALARTHAHEVCLAVAVALPGPRRRSGPHSSAAGGRTSSSYSDI
jgi:hypothetical protein